MIIFQIGTFKISEEHADKIRKDIEEQIKTHPHFVILPPEVTVNYYPETGPAEVIIRKEHEDDK